MMTKHCTEKTGLDWCASLIKRQGPETSLPGKKIRLKISKKKKYRCAWPLPKAPSAFSTGNQKTTEGQTLHARSGPGRRLGAKESF